MGWYCPARASGVDNQVVIYSRTMSQTRLPIFWLLIAATISIDAVAFTHTSSSSSATFAEGNIYRTIVCDALLAGQVSVVCIWAVLGTNKLLWMPALSAVVAAAFVAAVFQDSSESFLSTCRLYLSLYGFEAALLLTGLWLFRGSPYWRRRTESSSGWRFSLAHILLVMTAVAVLASMMRTGPFADESKWTNIGFACSVAIMALMSTIVWSLAWHWLLRLAATLGTALVLGCGLAFFTDFGDSAFVMFGSHFLVQAVVLSSWLGWGPILPRNIGSARSDNPHSGPQSQ
jgi:hypothetical protein